MCSEHLLAEESLGVDKDRQRVGNANLLSVLVDAKCFCRIGSIERLFAGLT